MYTPLRGGLPVVVLEDPPRVLDQVQERPQPATTSSSSGNGVPHLVAVIDLIVLINLIDLIILIDFCRRSARR